MNAKKGTLGRVADRRSVAEFFYEHEWSGEGHCECGWVPPDEVADSVDFDHAYHLADVLRETFDVQSRELPVMSDTQPPKTLRRSR